MEEPKKGWAPNDSWFWAWSNDDLNSSQDSRIDLFGFLRLCKYSSLQWDKLQASPDAQYVISYIIREQEKIDGERQEINLDWISAGSSPHLRLSDLGCLHSLTKLSRMWTLVFTAKCMILTVMWVNFMFIQTDDDHGQLGWWYLILAFWYLPGMQINYVAQHSVAIEDGHSLCRSFVSPEWDGTDFASLWMCLADHTNACTVKVGSLWASESKVSSWHMSARSVIGLCNNTQAATIAWALDRPL